MLTFKDLEKNTGLKIDYLRRCGSALETELAPHIRKGEHNTTSFDSAALGIFEQIKSLRDQGKTIPVIVRAIKENLGTSQSPETDTETDQNYYQNELQEARMEAQNANYNRELAVLKADNKNLQNLLNRYQSDILLLTDSRSDDLRVYMQNEAEKTAKLNVIREQRVELLEEMKTLHAKRKGISHFFFGESAKRRDLRERIEVQLFRINEKEELLFAS